MIRSGTFGWDDLAFDEFYNEEKAFGKKRLEEIKEKQEQELKKLKDMFKEDSQKNQTIGPGTELRQIGKRFQNKKKDDKTNTKDILVAEPPANDELQEELALRNINLKINPKEFVAVVGQVGAGKSALLYAILNEMVPKNEKARVSKKGNISFISQEAFMLNDTIKNNILFGEPYDEEKYQKTLKICQLEHDLQILPGGDQTEIGQRGINMSGGQKQRISIARSVYSSGDIYLIDDSLSALDADVGKKIMDQVFLGELGSTTRVMVTNIIKYLKSVDRVILVKEGAIVLDGKYSYVKKQPEFVEFCLQNDESRLSQVVEEEEGDESGYDSYGNKLAVDGGFAAGVSVSVNFEDMGLSEGLQAVMRPKDLQLGLSHLRSFARKTKTSEKRLKTANDRKLSKDEDERLTEKKNRRRSSNANKAKKRSRKASESNKKEKEDKKNLGALTTEETRSKGLTSSKVYCYYISSAGYCLVFITILFYLAFTAFKMITDWYVGKWATNSLNLKQNQYPLVYLVMIVILTLIVSLRSLTFGMTFSKASFMIFKKVTWNLLRRPLSFFDTTPSGVIINRCSKDVNDSDYTIPSYIFIILDYALRILTTLLFLCYIFPFFLIVMVIIIYVFFRSLVTFMKTMIEFKRLVKTSTSPLLSRVSELLSGIMTLRSYRMVPFMEKRFIRQSNLLAVVDYHERLSYRWFRIRVELPIWSCMVIGIVVLSIDKKYPFLGQDDPVIKGLLVAYLVTLVNLCGRLMIYSMKIMKEMSSIERLHEYAVWKGQERDWDSPSPKKKNWPVKGDLDLKDVRVRYRPGLPLVLRGLTFKVKTGEKVGIIGRTGSGKSTLLLALMRIIELDLTEEEKEKVSTQVYSEESYMKINGEDISRIGLHHARKSMVIIPQDPFLLQGTLRYNLDPMNEHTDDEIIEALEKVDGISIIGKALMKRNRGSQSMSRISSVSVASLKKKNLQGLNDPGSNPNETEGALYLQSESDIGDHQIGLESERNNFIKNPQKEQAIEILGLEIADQGSNLSLGQRQLICIARALVKKPKILLMDEATANIDERTDEVIQEVINNQLDGTTVLTIAHRLNTIIRYDKIVVLDKGVKAEEGSPKELLLNEESIFSDMVSKGGPDFATQMKEIVGII